MDHLVQSISHWNRSSKTDVGWVQNVAEHHLVEATFFVFTSYLKWLSLSWCLEGCCNNNPQPEVYKRNLSRHRVQTKKNNLDLQITLKIDLKAMMIKVMYTLTFHRLLWSILNVCSPRKTKIIQKKSIWSFLRHLTLIFYLPKVTKTIFPQVIFDVKFPSLFKSAVKNRYLRKGHNSIRPWKLTSMSKLMIRSNVSLCPVQPLSESFFRRWSILEDIWDFRLKWITVYILLNLKKIVFV